MPPVLPPRLLRAAGGAAAAALLTLCVPGGAQAMISDATVLASGPSVVALDGVAMAPDGTGGLVFREIAGGKSHIFVSRFVDGTWLPPRQVDVGQAYNSTFPAIGAGNGGRLVVVWVQEYGADVQDRLYSASLDPGAQEFQAPIPIDLDVRDGSDVAPSISMNAGGTAYLVYRVVLARNDPSLPPGYIDADIRAQRYSGAFWTAFGGPLDRNASSPMALPNAADGPKVATDVNGNALAAWREPDDDLIPRVYARRLFGTSQGFVKQVSPSKIGSKPLRGGVDAFSLAGSPFGEDAVVWRQLVASQDPYTRPRAFVNEIPNTQTDKAADFLGPRPIDPGGNDGPAGSLGVPSVSVSDDGSFVAGLGLDDSSVLIGGGEDAIGAPTRLDDGTSDVPGAPQVTRSAENATAAAWQLDSGGAAGVGVQETRSDGTPVNGVLSSPAGGSVSGLRMAGSGLGDAAIAFQQGSGDTAQIVAASVDAPPESFDVATPADFTRAKEIELDWDSAPHAIGGVTYTVQVDGEDETSGLSKTTYDLKPSQVDDGRHTVTVVATDPDGQETTSADATLLVDRTAPTAKLSASRRSRRLTVRLTDGAKGESSGVDFTKTKVSFGDGHKGSGRKTVAHRYARHGTYRVTVTLYDKAGNHRTSTRTVRV